MENNFETYQEFNESTADLINKHNITTLSLNNTGYDNKIINPELNIVFLNDKSYVIPETNPSKVNFSVAGWTHSVTAYNRKKCVRLSQIITETFSTYNELKNTKLFNLNLKSDMNIYTESRIRIEKNSTYVFSVEYDIYDGTYSDKDLSLNPIKYYNNETSSFEALQFNSTNAKFNVSLLKTVLNNQGKFIKYYYIKSNNYFENNALFRFELSATSTNNTAKIRIYNVNFYKGDILFNALSTKNNNMIKQNDNMLSISENGYDFTPIINPNVVTVGKYGANYTELTTAIATEKSNTIFEIISNITDTGSLPADKTNIIVNGHDFIITFLATFNIIVGNNTFNNVRFDFNNNTTGINVAAGNIFNNCEFSNSTSVGLQLTNSSYNRFIGCSFYNLVGKSIVLSSSYHNSFEIDNIERFFKSGTTNSKAIELTNSNFNEIIIKNCNNYYETESGNVILGPVDSIVYANTSNFNEIYVSNFEVFRIGETPYNIFKFFTSKSNRLKLKPISGLNAEISLYNYIYTDQSDYNYLDSHNKLDFVKPQLSGAYFPQTIYSDQVNEALNGVVSSLEGFTVTGNSGQVKLIGQLGVNIQNGYSIGQQTINFTNDSTTSYIKIFGNSGTTTSTHANENLTISGFGTNNLATLNLKCDNVILENNLLAKVIIPSNVPYITFKATDSLGSQAIKLLSENNGNSEIRVFGYQSTPDGLGRYNSDTANENLTFSGNTGLTMNRVTFKTKEVVNEGYTKLGSDAPATKKKLLTGTITGVSNPTQHAHGLTATKIIASSISVYYSGGEYIHPNDENTALLYKYRIGGSYLEIRPDSNATSLVNATYKCLIEYIE